ncbi:hypothetical protein SORBI_3003G064901 [Sorghum bicolor]|uniref:Uncharacterized protein n=1 Tax=Sorghum bicolor TaxID=4558 RepID=A0A1W0VW03_SORBI|nr:hypothetical protein SORBI_3003G064901 [Sorghum bicolor]
MPGMEKNPSVEDGARLPLLLPALQFTAAELHRRVAAHREWSAGGVHVARRLGPRVEREPALGRAEPQLVLVLAGDVDEVARHRRLRGHVVLEVLFRRVVDEREAEVGHVAGQLRDVAEVPAVPRAGGPVGDGHGGRRVAAELEHELGCAGVDLEAVPPRGRRGRAPPGDEAGGHARGLAEPELGARQQRVGRVVEALPQRAPGRRRGGVGDVEEDEIAAVEEHGDGGGGARVGGGGGVVVGGPSHRLGGLVHDGKVAFAGDRELRRPGVGVDDWIRAVGHPDRGPVGDRGEPYAEVPPVGRAGGGAVGSLEEAERELGVVGHQRGVPGEHLAGREGVRRRGGAARAEEAEDDEGGGQSDRHGGR